MDEVETPPYAFERGEHRDKVPVLKDWILCVNVFGSNIAKEFDDVVLAYVRGGGDCGSVLVGEGLIDRDLGVKAFEDEMEIFINKHLGSNVCENSSCVNSDLADDIDVDNFLRNFAVQAALLNSDSPLGNGNNYYLAQYDPNAGWAMVQYDHNGIFSSASADLCDAGQCYDDLVKWSILRRTCRAVEYSQMAGPLLTNDNLRAKYIEYVREFVNDVMTDDALLAQIRSHILAIRDEALKNDWNDFTLVFEQLELSQDDAWLHDMPAFDTKYIAFLPGLRARSVEIKKQLAAIDEGTFPRSMDDIGAGEVCVNWEATEARLPTCPEDCLYTGCYRSDFDVPAFCSPDDGKCYHGVIDTKCGGVGSGMQYLGMEGFENSDKNAFCWQDETLGPLKIAECPTYDVATDTEDGNDTECPEDCLYDACYRATFDVPAFCSPDDGKCYHGVKDTKCTGVDGGMQYDGMTAFEDSDKDTFCWQDETLGPLKLAECPTYYEANDDASSGGDGYATMRVRLLTHVLTAMAAAIDLYSFSF